MADIEMVNHDIPEMSKTEESPVQSGGGGGNIEMYGGSDFHMGHTPIGSEQKGGGGGTVDWVGEQGILNHTPVPPHGSTYPSDKGRP
jgi:hypothetical protein